ncbi:ribonuclease H-like domain-containing protein [Cubamyces lactineus]|nr:ribonuclease H-like domain-containing protein [Cubamyces lactineus]
MAPAIITYCATYDDAKRAYDTLSRFTTLIIDCEAHDLGRPGGTLSLLSISDIGAAHIFLIDVLSLTSPSHPALAALLSLLADPRITKVFWDGRSDALELLLVFGTKVAGVLDMQLVDVLARTRDDRPEAQERRMKDLAKFFQPLKDDLRENPAAYDGICRVRGLDLVVGLFRLCSKEAGTLKDPAVVAMHHNEGSAMWLVRPLPANLLQYAAHDLQMIALVYAHYMRKAWVRSSLEQIKQKSAGYVSMIRSREQNVRFSQADLRRFVPLEFTCGDGGKQGARYPCQKCEQRLVGSCYTKRVEERKSKKGRSRFVSQRSTLCRLCKAISLRNGEMEGGWVDL